jgi:hypothetical protein
MAMKTRALLTIRLPIAEPQIPTPGWDWHTPPPDPNIDNLKWVIDGSRKFASEYTLSTTGCGVAVLNPDGRLLAYAYATPPHG